MRTQVCSLFLFLTVGFMTVTIPLTNVSAETAQRTARGTVIATNLTVVPQTIVVKVLLPNKEELIVGARVPTDTRITRGTRAAQLADIKMGESADITYLKASDGLIARSIHVR